MSIRRFLFDGKWSVALCQRNYSCVGHAIHKLYIGRSLWRLRDCLHKGHSAFSLPQPTIQVQQNRCPHSVEQLAVRSSRQSVQFLLALTSAGTDEKSSVVKSSSSAGIGSADSSNWVSSISDTGFPSISVSEWPFWENFVDRPDVGSDAGGFDDDPDRSNMTRRCNSRITMRMPSNEYEGGRIFGFSGTDDILRMPSKRLTGL